MALKKKRSAKQLANDKRLGRAAKKRAGAKKLPRKKKTTSRKVAKRKGTRAVRKSNPKRSAKSHLWIVFRCQGKSVKFLGYSVGGSPSWVSDRGKALIMKSKDQAKRYAEGLANMRGQDKYQLGAVSEDTTTAQIRAACNPK